MKIVINRCYGGFSISEACIMLYAKKIGVNVFPDRSGLFTTYWLVPEDNTFRIKATKIQDNFTSELKKDRVWSSEFISKNTIDNRDIRRDDPILVECVEELGFEASGEYAELKVVDIPDGVDWEIEEYDGLEWVSEKHRVWS